MHCKSHMFNLLENRKLRKENVAICYLAFFVWSAYLLVNTGFVADDFAVLIGFKNRDVYDILVPSSYIHIPGLHYIRYVHYFWLNHFSGEVLLNLLKIANVLLALYLTTKFFEIYADTRRALLISFIFVFFPSHDSTVFWYFGQYLTMNIAFYLYSFYLAHRNRLVLGCFMALFASFTSYGSPPIALALFILCVLNKQFMRGAVLFVPNVVFCVYYIAMVTTGKATSYTRLPANWDLMAITKQFVLQIVTFCDAMFGPSMWLKLYLAFTQLSVKSWVIGAFVTFICYKAYSAHTKIRGNNVSDVRHLWVSGYNLKLVICFVVLTFTSLLMFAVNGYYPQLTFNLGNRTTIYGSLLIAYLIVMMPVKRKLRDVVIGMLIFSILGISDHWKVSNVHQQEVMMQIRNNEALQNYTEDKPIYVVGNQYSKYGPISHIEFLSESWVVDAFLKLALERDNISVKPLNRRFIFTNGSLVDTKYNMKTAVGDYINVYDSDRDVLMKLQALEINKYLDCLPVDKRHWILMLDVKFIKDLIRKLMPRLKYAL